MQHWFLPSVISTDKQHPRAIGPDAPRVTSTGHLKPQVLFSHPECRAVLVPLAAGERMDDHMVRERAVVEVVSGHVCFHTSTGEVDCPAGSLISLAPAERHAVRALEDSRMLLLLTPWRPHAHDAEQLPKNATAAPA